MKKILSLFTSLIMSISLLGIMPVMTAGAETSENFEYEISDDIMDQYDSDAEHKHSYTSEVTKQPTCTETGIETFICECEDTYTEIIPATGHKYTTKYVKPTCTEKGYTLHECSVCGDSYKDNYTDSLGHSYRYISKSSTYFEKGYTANECLTCGTITDTKYTSILQMSAPKATAGAYCIKLSWNKIPDAQGYEVWQLKSGKWTKIKTTSSTTFTVSKLPAGTSQKFAIKPYTKINNKIVYGCFSKQLYTSTNPETVNFSLTAGFNNATVKWHKVTGASGYKVYYKTAISGWKLITTVNNSTTSYNKTGLTSGKVYYFTVKAYRTINGTTFNGAYATKSVKIKEIKAKSIKLNKSNITIQRGNSYSLKATVNPKNTTDKITWTSSNKNVATVSSNGVVKGIKPGNATIYATINGKKAICKVTVTKRKTQSIKLNISNATIVSGNTLKLTRTVSPSNSEEGVVWSSSNSSVASITIQGQTCIVTGRNKGTAIITAQSGSKKATCKVTVVGNETKIGQTLYSDRNCQIIYKGYEFDNSSFGHFAIKVQIINKTNKTICVQTRNDSVNSLMTDFIFSPEIAPYKTANDKIELMDYQMENDGIDRNNIRWLDFNFHYFDWDNWLDDVDTPNIHISF